MPTTAIDQFLKYSPWAGLAVILIFAILYAAKIIWPFIKDIILRGYKMLEQQLAISQETNKQNMETLRQINRAMSQSAEANRESAQHLVALSADMKMISENQRKIADILDHRLPQRVSGKASR